MSTSYFGTDTVNEVCNLNILFQNYILLLFNVIILLQIKMIATNRNC